MGEYDSVVCGPVHRDGGPECGEAEGDVKRLPDRRGTAGGSDVDQESAETGKTDNARPPSPRRGAHGENGEIVVDVRSVRHGGEV